MSTLNEYLKNVLADSYILYLKTQNYHWNVTGPNFNSLHIMFQAQYNDLFTAVDLLAERIRAPGTFASYSKMATIAEGNENSSAQEMVKELAQDQQKIVKTLAKALSESQKCNDDVTTGIITDRIEIHQKNAWMLNSSL
jgi:starvation-inducible DNA-binding protein